MRLSKPNCSHGRQRMMHNANVCNHVEVKNSYAPKLTFDEVHMQQHEWNYNM